MKSNSGEANLRIDGAKNRMKKKRVSKCSYRKPILHDHRRRLMVLINKLARKHDWLNAGGALSVLLKGTPRGCSLTEDRRHFLLAMELLRRFPNSHDHIRRIKQIFDVWMSKLPWARKCSMKKHLIQMELSLFCLTQGNIKEAHQTTKFLSQDPESGRDPHVHLIHGLTSYQLWYSELPQEMQVKDFDVFLQLDDSGMLLNGGPPQHMGLHAMSSGHDSANIQCAEIFAHSNSESSICNEKAHAECSLKSQRKWSHLDEPSHKFYESGCAATDEDIVDLASNVVNRANVSIFHIHGLDACLLPIRLHESLEDPQSRIISHKKLLNQHYMDAVKHLRAALRSNPPILSALHPLIQLLLLGDQVEDALKELDEFIRISKSILPLRYRARLLECIGDGQHAELAKCYEQIVETDPSHVPSLKKLINLHVAGNYDTVELLEHLAMHMDHTDGDSGMWGELASCFLKIQSLQPSEYDEDEESTTSPTSLCQSTTLIRIPKALTGADLRSLWMYRCRWWYKCHFSKAIYISEIQMGDLQRMAYKAACACHMYGPDFKYVTKFLGKGDKGLTSFLQRHRKSPLKLSQALTTEVPF